MLISLSAKFIFFHVPKTGGKSITKALLPWVYIPFGFRSPPARWILGRAFRMHGHELSEEAANVAPSESRAVRDLHRALRGTRLVEMATRPWDHWITYHVASLRYQLRVSPRAFAESYRNTPLHPLDVSLGFVHAHKPAKHYKQLLPASMLDYFKFAAVRDPYTWVRSWYHFLKKIWDLKLTTRLFLEPTARKTQMYKGCSFESFVDLVCDGTILKRLGLDPKAPQLELLKDDSGGLLVDFVCKQENLQSDFAEVCKRIGIETELPRINAAKRVETIERPDLRSRVHQALAGDCEAFGYTTAD